MPKNTEITINDIIEDIDLICRDLCRRYNYVRICFSDDAVARIAHYIYNEILVPQDDFLCITEEHVMQAIFACVNSD